VPYPGVLMATGLNDTRVSPWMPAKFTARLQAVTTSSRPVLLRVEQTGGHSFQSKDRLEAALADAFSFVAGRRGWISAPTLNTRNAPSSLAAERDTPLPNGPGARQLHHCPHQHRGSETSRARSG
jgi:Prolyl oligopeptidase family